MLKSPQLEIGFRVAVGSEALKARFQRLLPLHSEIVDILHIAEDVFCFGAYLPVDPIQRRLSSDDQWVLSAQVMFQLLRSPFQSRLFLA